MTQIEQYPVIITHSSKINSVDVKHIICVFSSVLDIIWNLTAPLQTHQAVLNETADSLMDSSLREMAELLSDAEDKVDRTRGLNLRSRTVLQQLEVT